MPQVVMRVGQAGLQSQRLAQNQNGVLRAALRDEAGAMLDQLACLFAQIDVSGKGHAASLQAAQSRRNSRTPGMSLNLPQRLSKSSVEVREKEIRKSSKSWLSSDCCMMNCLTRTLPVPSALCTVSRETLPRSARMRRLRCCLTEMKRRSMGLMPARMMRLMTQALTAAMYMPPPVARPTPATDQRLAAVVRPRTTSPRSRMDPAPRKPMPETTWAA